MSEPQQFQYSVKLESAAKGLIMPTIHVFSNNLEGARVQAVQQLAPVIEDLKGKGLSVAPVEKGGKTD